MEELRSRKFFLEEFSLLIMLPRQTFKPTYKENSPSIIAPLPQASLNLPKGIQLSLNRQPKPTSLEHKTSSHVPSVMPSLIRKSYFSPPKSPNESWENYMTRAQCNALSC